MKRAFLMTLVLAAMLATSVAADGSMDGYIEMLKSDLKTQKVAVTTAAMDLSEADAEIFWPIYREYDAEMSKFIDGRIALIKKYATNYETLTDVVADEIMTEGFKLDDQRLKLGQKYYKKMAKGLSPRIAARFFQIENAIYLLIRLQVAAELPLVPTE